jgi:hypothetical protein
MADSNSDAFDTIGSLEVLTEPIRSHQPSDRTSRMPAPVDQMILRALLAQPLVTPGEAQAAAERAAANPEPFPFSLTSRSN